MDPHVSSEMGSLFAGVVTLSAVEGIFPRMCEHVGFEIESLFAGVTTL